MTAVLPTTRKATGVTLWLTGLPSAGKTTIAQLVTRQLETLVR